MADVVTVTSDDGARLWAARSGPPGAPLVLCHGGPGLWDMFTDVAALLPIPVVRWDQRGCGRSERCAGPWTIERSVADLDAVRQHFGLERMTLLGHSWGAYLALRYALARPDRVSTLVYVSGTGIGPDADWYPAFVENLRARLGDHPGSPGGERERAVVRWSAEFEDRERALDHAGRMADPWFGINCPCHHALDAERGRACGGPELHAACRGLPVPVLIVDGGRDLRPRTAVDSLERALPHVRRVVLPEAGHLPWAEDPDGFREAVAAAVR
ncbi:alpha/beta fold hydrolase [Streptomyces sp. V3I7]|uniref:alpha/beta fold hydrolase n=1 Tax=Streptomyces sp. V3I7 TaxID=3042278 RepID=UPI00278A383D|nr:alpha/beta fold hydrolase [Streptomyces sp. V3I7]MDQ0993224.1 proline iminopeptidase [Streptomyces sp. V3I7]